MSSFSKRVMQATTGVAALALVAGCQQQLQNNNSRQADTVSVVKETTSQQLIVKFKPRTISCDRAGIASLSSATRISLEFIRPMSGDACVITQFATNAEGLSTGQKKLRQHPSVELVELDAMMKTM